jgi:hypothetical protein
VEVFSSVIGTMGPVYQKGVGLMLICCIKQYKRCSLQLRQPPRSLKQLRLQLRLMLWTGVRGRMQGCRCGAQCNLTSDTNSRGPGSSDSRSKGERQ